MIQTTVPEKNLSSKINTPMFSLLSLSNNENNRYDVKVDFSSEIINDFVTSIPQYNCDKDPFTGGFKLAFYTKQNSRLEFTTTKTQQLNNRLKNLSEKRIEIFQPKPSHNYCEVCKQSFIDYAKHILHKVHIKNIKSSRFNQQIEDLIQTFHRKPTRPPVSSELGELTQKRRIVEGSGKAPIALRVNKDATDSTHCSFGNFTTTKLTKY